VPVRWYYEIYFSGKDGVTTVTVVATYPVEQDRDEMIAMDGSVGWNEIFESFDVLLAPAT
jgi:hypothetical protein